MTERAPFHFQQSVGGSHVTSLGHRAEEVTD